ncbi:hypothetical protein C8N25_1446 [Algoriphagus antarcticus]|uniref:Uncharacterized protein n=1 Tax=Algoriphagus antarcticus TaxID=238540 RepID=A0A3E0D484_9BACT|nr:hypothetical protein C8N25_1446 [Algoriphagus antarcticus]
MSETSHGEIIITQAGKAIPTFGAGQVMTVKKKI